MVLFNYATKEITAKIVYYGPGLCGKTTNLQFIYDSLPSNNKSKMLSLATKTDRTLFFDFLPLDLGKIRGMRTKLQLYTVPGQVYYNSTRQLVLKGADGVVFVADSQDFALDANQESLQNLEDNLKRQGVRISEIPLVLQFNKRDLPNAMPTAEIDDVLNRWKIPTYESVATTGLGVEQTLKGITQIVLAHLVKKYGLEGSGPVEQEIEVLNPDLRSETPDVDSVWADDVLATPVGAPGAIVVDHDQVADSLPLVASELVAAPPIDSGTPFDELIDRFEAKQTVVPPPAPPKSAPAPPAAPRPAPAVPPAPRKPASMEVPITSVEIPIPDQILSSLPSMERKQPTSPGTVPTPEPERRMTDGLVREITLPLNLSLEEIRKHKKLKLKITLDVNLLP